MTQYIDEINQDIVKGPASPSEALGQIVMRSKLQKPKLPANFVPRPSLNSKLGQFAVTMISASAGSGKSTAVSAWLDTQPRYLWYRLDPWDNDLDVFFTHFALGVDTLMGTGPDQGLQQWVSARATMGDDTLIRAMVAHLEQLSGPVVWIFDDYHEAQSPSIHSFLGQLMLHLGLDQKVCIISREDPPIMVVKVRAEGRLSWIREADLRMTIEEADILFDQVLNPDQLALVHQRTEGWIAGLQLTGQTLRVADSVRGFIEVYRESNHYMMDFLVEEVLARQPDTIRNFLIRTSIFDDFCPELADASLELEPGESENILGKLVRRNCFVIPLLEGTWFRYHQLFRELLRQRLKVHLQKQGGSNNQNIEALYFRAGAWFEANGQVHEAIHYYLQGRPMEAARLVEGLWAQMDLELRSDAWLSLAQRLPKDIVWQSPVLTSCWGWALLNAGQLESCIPWLDRGEALYEQMGPDTIVFERGELDQLPATLLSAKAYIAAAQGDFAQVITLNKALSDIATKIPYQRLWVIETFVSTIHWSQGDLEEGIQAMRRAQEYSGKDGQHLTTMVLESLVWVIAHMQIEKGDLIEAKIALESAIDRLKHMSIGPILIAIYSTYLAEIATIQGDFTTAYSLLSKAEAYGISYDYLDWRQNFEHLMARLHMLQGHFDLARDHIGMGRDHRHHNPLPETMSFDDLELLVALREYDQSRNLHELNLKQRISHHYKALIGQAGRSNLPDYTAEFKWKLLMRYWDSSIFGSTSEIYGLCLELLQRAKDQKRHLHELDYTLLAARLSPNERLRQNHERSAQELGVLEGYILPHILWGTRTWTPIDRIQEANNKLSEPLTPRELEMLQLIANGLSNEEISQKLYIAISTVKSYNNTLYTKLGVKRRTEAIFKAKDLGLI